MEKENDTKYPILGKIDSPADLRALPEDKLPDVCRELRNFIIESCSTKNSIRNTAFCKNSFKAV